MRKTRFDLVFKDPNNMDWHITLHTSEPKTDEEIEDLIMNFADMCNTDGYEYSPVDIMDRLVIWKTKIGIGGGKMALIVWKLLIGKWR